MNKKIKNFGGNRFIRILSDRREKIDKLAERINPGNLQEKEIIIQKISSKSISKKESCKGKKKKEKHNINYYINLKSSIPKIF